MSNIATFSDYLAEAALDEALITKVDSKGRKTKRKKKRKGFKLVNGKYVKMSSSEKLNRSKGSKRGNRKKVGKRNQINRKTAKAKKKRSNMGVR